jgi:hypothetical protein
LQDTYAAIPVADRMATQNDLTWGGDFSGPIDGQFSERLVQAVKAYQTRHKNPVTGVMSAAERAALATAVAPRKQAVGWRLTEDPVTGARVGLPGRLATNATPGPNGTRWASEQGQLQVETFRIDTGATLEGVFEQQKKLPRRRVESSSIQTESFVITGMQGLKKMVVRGYARNGEVRGITILYDQAMEGSMDPIVVAMASAFTPFAAGDNMPSPTGLRRKVEYGSGIVVSAVGHIVTDRQLADGCQVIVIPGIGNAERLAEDSASGLALLRIYGTQKLNPISLLSENPVGNELTLVGVADPQAQAGRSAVSTVRARLGAEAEPRPLEAAPAQGFTGAAAIDGGGRFVGMVVLRSAVVAGPAGASPVALVPRDKVINFLEANYVAPASGQPGLDDARAALTRVICVRK